MSFIRLWQRYLFFKISTRMLLFLGLFYALYLLIDVSTHLQQISTSLGFFSPSLYLYYALIFSQIADLFIPLSFLLATLSTLFSLAHYKELLAFQVSGLGKRKLFIPFFILSLMGMALMYSNEEWVRPKSVKFIDNLESNYLKRSHDKRQETIHNYPISDTAKVVFATFNAEEKALVDTFFIKDRKTLYHAKKLSLYPAYSTGKHVDVFKQNSQGHFIKTHTYDHYTFFTLKIDPHLIDVKITPVKHLSLSALFEFSFSKEALPLFPLPQIRTHFFYKAFMPFCLPFILLFIFPFATRFSRKMPTLLITALSLFCFVMFYILQNASIILGENSLLLPYKAIIIVPLLAVITYSTAVLIRIIKRTRPKKRL